MIEERGIVIAEDGDDIWVETIRKSTCAGCSARQGCGQGVLARLSADRANQIRVCNTGAARIGDQVIIGINETALLRASMLVYGVPLAFLLLGAICAGQLWAGGDMPAIVGAAAGLCLGFAAVRRRCAQREQVKPVLLQPDNQYRPKICKPLT